jgi:hypothetical protein
MTSKPETYVLRIDIEQFVFEKSREEFESAINLELHICMKELREKLILDYEIRRPTISDPGNSARVDT